MTPPPKRTDFEIKFQHGTVRGALQRWRGNETRITCTGDVPRIVVDDENDSDIIPSVLAVGGVICFMFLSMGQAVPAMLGMGVMFTYMVNNQKDHIRKEPTTVALFRERDGIFQYLIDGFKAEGDVAPL